MSENAIELLPCPFCGFVPHVEDDDCIYPIDREKTVYVLNCYETGGGCSANILGYSPEDVIQKWNTRKNSEKAIPPSYQTGFEEEPCPYIFLPEEFEPLESEFEKALHDNLWEMYQK